MTLPTPHWISFDCYGTLIDWQSGVRRAFRELARVQADEEQELFEVWERIQWEKIQGSYAPYAEILHVSFREAAEKFGYHCPAYTGEAFLASLARWEPFQDVNPALFQLSHRHKLAIVSNVDRDLLGWTLRHFQVRFDALITAEDARCYKPNPEVFRYTLRKLSCTPEQIVHIACACDYDLRPANSLGLRVVFLNRQQLPALDFPVEAEIKTMQDLPALWNGSSVRRSVP